MDLLIDMSNAGLTMFLSAMKMLFWLKHGEKLKVIMNRLENSEFHYEKIDDFNPIGIIKNAKMIGIISCLTQWIVAQCTMAAAYVPASTMSFWYFLKDVPIVNMTKFEHLPYKTYVPFKHDTAIKYFLGCVTQFVPLHIHLSALVGVDGIFMNIINLIGANMVVMRGAFKTLRKACLKRMRGAALVPDDLYNSDPLEHEMMCEMKKCIRHLQMLFGSCQQAEDIFQVISFAQAVGSAYLFCSCLLLISTMPIYTNEFLKEMFYAMAIFVQLSLYCWTGNELTLKANDVSQGLWESDWLETRKPFKVCMIITMTRLQIPLYFTAGKFVPLILSTQISVSNGNTSNIYL
ncbi:hypothetical protein Trydic_g13060 [Trypoxylus dichotomus]